MNNRIFILNIHKKKTEREANEASVHDHKISALISSTLECK